MLFGKSLLLSIALWGVLIVVLRVGVIPPEDCGDDSREEVHAASVEAMNWMVRARQPDGRYVYIYNNDGTIPNSYGDVRHAGTTMALYQAAGRLEDPDALAAADGAMEWMIDRLIREDDWAALAPNGRTAPLGGSALMLASLVERRYATGDDQYDDITRDLARFLVASQRENGNFYVYWYADSGFDLDATSRYFPGEAWFALALMHNTFPNEGWDEPAWRAAEYVTQHRDEDEGVDFPPLADQWAAYALGEMRYWDGLPDRYIDYARALAGRWGLVVRSESQKKSEPLGEYIRGPDIRGSGIGTWAEGFAGLWRLAVADGRLEDIRPKIEERAICIAGLLAERQIDAKEALEYPDPDLAQGAIFTSAGDTRMDDQQHVFSGLLYIGDIMDGRIDREPD